MGMRALSYRCALLLLLLLHQRPEEEPLPEHRHGAASLHELQWFPDTRARTARGCSACGQ